MGKSGISRILARRSSADMGTGSSEGSIRWLERSGHGEVYRRLPAIDNGPSADAGRPRALGRRRTMSGDGAVRRGAAASTRAPAGSRAREQQADDRAGHGDAKTIASEVPWGAPARTPAARIPPPRPVPSDVPRTSESWSADVAAPWPPSGASRRVTSESGAYRQAHPEAGDRPGGDADQEDRDRGDEDEREGRHTEDEEREAREDEPAGAPAIEPPRLDPRPAGPGERRRGQHDAGRGRRQRRASPGARAARRRPRRRTPRWRRRAAGSRPAGRAPPGACRPG